MTSHIPHNETIVSVLKKLSKQYKADDSLKWKKRALDKAIYSLKYHDGDIFSADDALELENIGKGIAKRIAEIIETGTLAELIDTESPEVKAIKEFKRITGVGNTRAKKWATAGILTIDDLLKAAHENKIKLTHHIEIGLKYLDDFEKRIPREEIDTFSSMLDEIIFNLNDEIIYNICGSYRRGNSDSGDIDVLISHPTNSKYLTKIVKVLIDGGICIDHLTKNGNKKYMGVCKIADIPRRLDIRYIEYESYYAALLYFTGSKEFNVKIRQMALDLGYSLNEYGLIKKDTNEKIILSSEEELFDILGIEYVQPTSR